MHLCKVPLSTLIIVENKNIYQLRDTLELFYILKYQKFSQDLTLYIKTLYI